jgi:CubicO group peptidase (beta-lactamase class C family)
MKKIVFGLSMMLFFSCNMFSQEKPAKDTVPVKTYTDAEMKAEKQRIEANENARPEIAMERSGSTISYAELNGYIEQGLKDWQIPGLSIVIVKDGKIVLKKGFGSTATNNGMAVDENTLFFIASNSKLFTGTALAHLEVLGKLSLNDKITKYYPDFKLYDKTSTELVSIKDMLTHRIGTKTFQGDFTYWNSNLTRDEIMKRMRLLSYCRADYSKSNWQAMGRFCNRQHTKAAGHE